MNDYIQKAFCFDETVRIFAATTTNLCNKAKNIHNLYPTSNTVLGEALTMGAIMGATYKNGEHITIRIDGDGPAGKLLVEATRGSVRGYISNKEVLLKYNDGVLRTAEAVGKTGFINVTKLSELRKEPFTSTSQIIGKELAEDFTYYFAASEQIPSSVGLGYKIDNSNNVIAAGGFLLQVMPGCTEETITKIEKLLKEVPSVSKMIEDGKTPEDMINVITAGEYKLLDRIDLNYSCDCSKNKFYAGIKSLGVKEIESIINEEGKAEVKCNFCEKNYIYEKDELKKMCDEIKASI